MVCLVAPDIPPTRSGDDYVASVAITSPFLVNGDRVMDHLKAMGDIGRDPAGGISRVAYSEADLRGRENVIGLMRAAGLSPRVAGRRPGSDPKLPVLIIGSHIDSVPQGGNYDGIVGSLGAIEVAQTLSEAHVILRHPLEVIIFQNEEGGLKGSRAISGELREEELNQATRSGKTLRDGIAFIGGDPAHLADVHRKSSDIFAYLELHIEQSGSLNAEKINIGVVEGIVGNHRWDVTIEGTANHAGTTPMDQRHDALLAAAKFIEAVNREATSIPGQQVATVGRIQATPGAYNVVPGNVILGSAAQSVSKHRIPSSRLRVWLNFAVAKLALHLWASRFYNSPPKFSAFDTTLDRLITSHRLGDDTSKFRAAYPEFAAGDPGPPAIRDLLKSRVDSDSNFPGENPCKILFKLCPRKIVVRSSNKALWGPERLGSVSVYYLPVWLPRMALISPRKATSPF